MAYRLDLPNMETVKSKSAILSYLTNMCSQLQYALNDLERRNDATEEETTKEESYTSNLKYIVHIKDNSSVKSYALDTLPIGMSMFINEINSQDLPSNDYKQSIGIVFKRKPYSNLSSSGNQTTIIMISTSTGAIAVTTHNGTAWTSWNTIT